MSTYARIKETVRPLIVVTAAVLTVQSIPGVGERHRLPVFAGESGFFAECPVFVPVDCFSHGTPLSYPPLGTGEDGILSGAIYQVHFGKEIFQCHSYINSGINADHFALGIALIG